MGDLKEDLKDLDKAANNLQQAQNDLDQKQATADAEDKKLATTPAAQLQAQYQTVLNAEKAAVEAWRALRKAERQFTTALFELYQDVFAIGPIL